MISWLVFCAGCMRLRMSNEDAWMPIGNVGYGIQKMTHASSIHSDTLRGVGHLIPWQRFDEIKAILLKLY